MSTDSRNLAMCAVFHSAAEFLYVRSVCSMLVRVKLGLDEEATEERAKRGYRWQIDSTLLFSRILAVLLRRSSWRKSVKYKLHVG